MARITAIIPTYRRPHFLRRAIFSVLAQTYSDFEVHVWDNASGDETRVAVEAIANQDSRVKYHCRPENIGPQSNFISAMAAASTPFFHVLSDDDLIFPDFFATAIATLEEHPEVLTFSGATIVATPENDVLDVPLARWRDAIYPPPQGMLEMIRLGHPDFTATLFRREVLQKVGSLNGAITFCDVEFLCRCAAHYPIAISTVPCGVYSIHPASAGIVREADSSYSPTVIMAPWMEIVESIQSLETISKGDRRAAKAMMLARLRNRIFLRGLKAAAVGHRADAHESADLLHKSFHKTVEPWLIELLATLAREPVARILTPIVETVRRRRAGLFETNLSDRRRFHSYSCALRRISPLTLDWPDSASASTSASTHG